MKKLVATFLIYDLVCLFSQQPKKTKKTTTVLDSSGSPESGFILGQNFWMGSIKGCEAVRQPHTITLSNRFQRYTHADLLTATAPFDVDYRVVYAAHKSPWQIQVEFLLASQVSIFKSIIIYLFIFLLYVLCNGYICRW